LSTDDKNKIKLLKEEENVCGFAEYINNENNKGLFIYLLGNKNYYSELLNLRFDMPSETFFNLKIRGLKDEGRIYESLIQNYPW
jgi:hypothetical protein